MAEGSGADLTGLLASWREGNRAALDKLAPLIYPELRRIAHRHLYREGDACRFSTTELVHEVYVKMAEDQLPDWQSRVHFFGIAARLIRQILVDEARERKAQKRGSGIGAIPIDELHDVSDKRPADVLTLHEALTELARVDERKSRILELRYFGGLEGDEIAEAMEVSPATVARDLRVARAWLKSYLSA